MTAVGAVEALLTVLSDDPPADKVDAATKKIGSFESLQLENICFAYTEHNPTLQHINLQLNRGEHVAIVGASGAGKSTLLKLLLRFHTPDFGIIRVNGLNLNQIEKSNWYQHIAWVPQQPRLFAGTLRDNVCLGLRNRTEPEILQALRLAHAEEILQQLPHGMDTLIGDSGHGLSGGQVQRIALARAILRGADLLLFDEATANLDLHSERLIQKALAQYTDGRTLISIAHRLSTVIKADRIVVLDQGRIIEQGNHQQLLAQQGHYALLLQAQDCSV